MITIDKIISKKKSEDGNVYKIILTDGKDKRKVIFSGDFKDDSKRNEMILKKAERLWDIHEGDEIISGSNNDIILSIDFTILENDIDSANSVSDLKKITKNLLKIVGALIDDSL
jgi:hypothetical protein